MLSKLALRRLTRDYVAGHWEPSIGKDLTADHYRETAPGKRHAVCPEKSNVCDVHVDKYNAHSQTIKHVIYEAPEVPIALGIGALVGNNYYQKTKDAQGAIGRGLVISGAAYLGIRFLQSIFTE